MIVDAHLHIWRAIPDHPNPSATLVSPTSPIPVELLDEYMDEHQVERAVLVQPMYPGEDNSYIADTAAARPERFAAVCVVIPTIPGAEDRLDYWVRERGCRGLRLRPRVPAEEASFGAPETAPLWERARQLNVVINLLASGSHMKTTARLAERYPDVNIIVDHMAHPDVSAGVADPGFQDLLALARYPRVYVKPTGYHYISRQRYPFQDCWPLVRALYDTFGPERLVWGSDFPHVLLATDYGRNLRVLEQALPSLTQDEKRLIMGGNAARLYWS